MEHSKSKLGLNAMLNILKTVLKMLFPLITYPYVARVLEVDNIGKVNYVYSIVTNYGLIAMLGISVYAVREGARLRDDRKALNDFANEVFTINVISTIIAIIALLLSSIFIKSFAPYHGLILLMGITIPLTTIGADWVNSIYEDYLYITIRYLVFQVIALICTFKLIRDKNDYYAYAFCTIISACGASLLNIFYIRKYVKLRITTHINFKHHIKPIMLLFATNLASMIYSSSDTMMLGLMTTDFNVGIYGTAAKIYNIFKQVLFAIVVVCLPRFSYMLANESKEEYEKSANKIYSLVFILAIPLVMGIFLLSKAVVSVIAGPGYEPATITLQIKCFAILFAIFGYFNMQLVLLPAKRDKGILLATLGAGLFNVIANLILIPRFKENAAAFTTLCSELIVFFVTHHMARDIVSLRVSGKTWIQTIISTFLMGCLITVITHYIANDLIQIVVAFISGVVIYFGSLSLFRNELIIEGIGLVKKKMNS